MPNTPEKAPLMAPLFPNVLTNDVPPLLVVAARALNVSVPETLGGPPSCAAVGSSCLGAR